VGYVKTVVVPVKTIKAGTVITKEELKKVEKVFPYPPKGFITDIDFAVGKIAKVTLKEGQPIRKYQLEERYLILPGQEVKIIFRKPYLVIETQGTALDRGKIGSQIRVRYRNKIFLGRVKNENTVVVELP
jgi:flagella basal body P-ring formation protein FlgA